MKWLVFLTLVLGVLGASPLIGQVAATVCYDVRLKPWDPPIIGPDSLLYAVPPRILLDSTASFLNDPSASADQLVRRLSTPAGSLPTPQPHIGWVQQAPDSLQLFWSDGFVGVVALVEQTATGFVGIAREIYDADQQQLLTTSISGDRVDCNAPVVYRLNDQRPLVRSLPLMGGDSLVLGASPWNQEGWFESSGGSYEGTPTLSTPFNDPVLARVRTSRETGAIRQMELTYRSETEFERIRDRLLELNGPPTDPAGWSRTGPRGLRWENRTTSIYLLWRSDRTPQEVLLVLEDPRVR